MIDGKGLLDQLLGAAGGQGGSGGGLGGALGGLLGGGNQGGLGGGSGGLGSVLGQVGDYARQNPGLATAMAGGIGAVLMGGGRGASLRPNALTLGGLAGIGALAYKAYQQYKINNPDAPRAAEPPHAGEPAPRLPADSPFAPHNATVGENGFALSIVSAMIAAAKADGHIDDQERQKILGKLAEGGLSAEEQTFLDNEMAAPLNIDKVVSAAGTPEEGIQLYAASLLAISVNDPADRAYLDMLAARLGIDAVLKANIEQTVAQASTRA